MKKTTNIFAAIIASGLLIASCGSPQKGGEQQEVKEEAKLSGAIKIDGSSTVYPITEAVAEVLKSFSNLAPRPRGEYYPDDPTHGAVLVIVNS